MARILIGVSGGIAAYKSIELARLATLAGHGVRVLMTPAAQRFVGAATFEGIVGAPVLVSEFDPDPARGAFPGEPAPEHAPISHLALAENADLFIVAPGSANTIAKLAAGICDSLLSTSFLACTSPRLIAPAMNGRMWEAGATAANVATLRERGVSVLEPIEGRLASRGESGKGRMQEPAAILEQALELLPGRGGSLTGVRVLVTAGGTREAIDQVRFIGNPLERTDGRGPGRCRSRARRRGHDDRLQPRGPRVRRGSSRWRLPVAADLAAAADLAFEGADVLLMAAAVADFRPTAPSSGKMVREGSGGMELELEPTEDVLAALSARRRPGQVLVGFAAEHGGDFISRARGKLERKGLDAIVVNDVSDPAIGFDSADNEATIIEREGETPIPRGSKRAVAEAVLDRVEALRAATPGR